MLRWAIALCTLVGCDAVFRLDHLGPPIDAGTDALDAFIDVCPVSYVPIVNAPKTSRYRFIPAARAWSDAEADCRDDDKLTSITHLVVFDSQGENDAIDAFVLDALGTTSYDVHVGYARNSGDDPYTGFFAVTGEPVPNTEPPWGPTEPNNGYDAQNMIQGPPEPIVVVEYQKGLVDAPVDYPTSYLCECDHRPVTKMFAF